MKPARLTRQRGEKKKEVRQYNLRRCTITLSLSLSLSALAQNSFTKAGEGENRAIPPQRDHLSTKQNDRSLQ